MVEGALAYVSAPFCIAPERLSQTKKENRSGVKRNGLYTL